MPISNAFDGALIGNGLDYAGTVAGDQNTIIFDFGYGFLNGKTVEVYIGSNPPSTHQWGLDGTNWVNHGSTTNDWISLGTGTNTSKVHAICYGNENGAYIAAVRVAGKQLVDPGIIPVGSLAQSYSSALTSSTGFRGSEPAANAFDGSTSTICSAVGSGLITFAPTQTFPSNSAIRIYLQGSGSQTVTVNGGAAQTITGNSWQTVNFTNSSASSFTLTIQASGGVDSGLRALEIGGTVLVDSGSIPSIASTVRANPTAGFSIVTWKGNQTTNSSVGHGLNKKPELIIVKNRDAVSDWYVFGDSIDSSFDERLALNTDAANTSSTSAMNATAPTSAVFTVGANAGTNGNNNNIVAYCFTSVEGYSAFGKYTGNASTDGPFVYTGFRPAFLLIKNATTAARNWFIYDTSRVSENPNKLYLRPNLSNGEATISDGIDFLSNGFKLRQDSTSHNGSGNTMIYAAFAENPFKTARAR